MNKYLLIILILLFSIAVDAQNKVTGLVIDSSGKSLPNVTVSLMNEHMVLKGYTLSNEKGGFTVIIPNELVLNQFSLQVTVIGYKKTIIPLQLNKDNYQITMQSENRSLAPVIIKGERTKLKISGDTLTYDVRAFSSPQDRVIEDVIK